jgi:hypothetical protein
VDIEDITEKYTGQRLGLTDLTAAWHTDNPAAQALAHAVERAAYALGEVEADLAHCADSVSRAIEAACEAVVAPAGQRIRTLNRLGELQANGPRFDLLIALRADRVEHLRILTRLWQETAAAQTPAADVAQVLAALGFTQIPPAHPSTRAAYGHRRGHRHIDVSLDPFGEPGIEVNAGDTGTVSWSVTVGPDVPVPVLAAVLRAATTIPTAASAPGPDAVAKPR